MNYASYHKGRVQQLDMAELGFVAGAIAGTVTGSNSFDLRGVTGAYLYGNFDLNAAQLLIGYELLLEDGATWIRPGYIFGNTGLTVVGGGVYSMVTAAGINRTQYFGGLDVGAPNSVVLPAWRGRLVIIQGAGTVTLNNLDLVLAFG